MSQSADSYYQSFLLRCWLAPASNEQEPPLWRFEVQNTASGSDAHRFRTLKEAYEFMENVLQGNDTVNR